MALAILLATSPTLYRLPRGAACHQTTCHQLASFQVTFGGALDGAYATF